MDIRVDTKFFQHPKTMKLQRLLGPGGVVGLLRLWLWAAENRPSGVLHGLGPDDLDLIAGGDQTDQTDQTGPRSSFCSVAKELGWVDEEDGVLVLHEWAQHNPWAADAPNRSDRGRFSKLASVAPAVYLGLVAEGRTSITAEDYRAIVERLPKTTKRQATVKQPLSKPEQRLSKPEQGLAPVPSPSPSPVIKDDPGPPPVDNVDNVNKTLQLYRRFPGYRQEDGTKERVWIEDLLKRFKGLEVKDEVEKALEWVRIQGFEVKNSRAYILKWLERVQKERS